MNSDANENHRFALAIAAACINLERQLDCSLSAIRGVSFAEYRLLLALSGAPDGKASRVDAARSVGLTASGVTRALRPLEKIGLVTTEKNKRDARRAMATLTPAGQALVKEASGIVNDTVSSMLERAPKLSGKLNGLSNLLDSLRT